MKILIVVVCHLTVLARASLEPLGYRLPGSYPQSNYLTPSPIYGAPDNRYVPPSVRSGGQETTKFDNQLLSTDLSVPWKNSPTPFVEYLPANRDHDDRNSAIDRSNSRPDSQYLRPNNDQQNFVNSLPSSDFVVPMEDRDFGKFNVYLEPNVQSDHSSEEFSSRSEHDETVHRHNGIDKENSGYHKSNRDGRYPASGSSGYRYNAPENHIPAQYEFDYKVKDNNGNDYGHKEDRNGEITRGVYMVLLPDGRRQIVQYEADSHGYRPTITYEETGLHHGSDKQGYQY